jgi:hypothetical protein
MGYKSFAVALAALGLALTAPPAAEAGSAKFYVKNDSPRPIVVVADTNREAHYIPAGATQTFVELNIGDQVTFRAYEPGPGNQPGQLLGSDCFGTPLIKLFKIKPNSRDIKWAGNRFEADD